MRYLAILLLATGALAVDAKAPELTEIHALRLQVDQKDAMLAQRTLQDAVNKFTADCQEFKKADHFPDNAVCDINVAGIRIPEPKK